MAFAGRQFVARSREMTFEELAQRFLALLDDQARALEADDSGENFRCNGCQTCQSCRFCVGCLRCEDCTHCEDCEDCIGCTQSKRNRACADCSHIEDCRDCDRSRYLVWCVDCEECTHCLACVGLSGAEFCVLNERFSRREYFEMLAELRALLADARERGIPAPGIGLVRTSAWVDTQHDDPRTQGTHRSSGEQPPAWGKNVDRPAPEDDAPWQDVPPWGGPARTGAAAWAEPPLRQPPERPTPVTSDRRGGLNRTSSSFQTQPRGGALPLGQSGLRELLDRGSAPPSLANRGDFERRQGEPNRPTEGRGDVGPERRRREPSDVSSIGRSSVEVDPVPSRTARPTVLRAVRPPRPI